MLRILKIVLPIILLFGAGGYYLYQDARVRDLFQPIDQKRSTKKVPSRFREPSDAPRKSIGTKKDSTALRVDEPTESPKVQNQTPNDVVARVLLQILAAQKLSDGVSIRSTDKMLVPMGVVDSEEKRQKILAIIEKGRETRQIDATNLIVR